MVIPEPWLTAVLRFLGSRRSFSSGWVESCKHHIFWHYREILFSTDNLFYTLSKYNKIWFFYKSYQLSFLRFQVPHLLKLKTSPGVQFAGIDEPDDVVNLTHQELFKRGGFLMFHRAALEPLSLCMCTLYWLATLKTIYIYLSFHRSGKLMIYILYKFKGNLKKMSEILQELSGTGKWKWMMHYGDSRRLKENAR